MYEADAFARIFDDAAASSSGLSSPPPQPQAAEAFPVIKAATPPVPAMPGPEPAETCEPGAGSNLGSGPTDPAGTDVYARRRKTLSRAIIAAAVLGGAAVWHMMGRTNLPGVHTAGPQAATAAPTPAQAQSATAQVEAVLSAAHDWHETHSTYAGWTPDTAGFAAATGADTVVVTADIGGVCYYSGIIPGKATQVLNSPQACAPGALAQVQADLNANDEATASADNAVLTRALNSAAVAARYWARSHAGSFAAMPALSGVDAAVHAGGASVTLTARSADGSCMAQTLTASGGGAPGAC